MEELQKAYLAGLFDGDGSVFMRKVFHKDMNRDNVLVEVSFTLQSMETLEWIAGFFGGTPKQSHSKHRAYSYKRTGKKAIEIVKLIEPYVITKRRQVNFVLFAYNTFFFDARGGRGAHSVLTPELIHLRELSCDIMHLLNKRDSMYFYGKSDEFSGRLTPLMQDLRDMVILSQATEGEGSVEGATTSRVSPNNNPDHERPTLIH